MSLLQQTHPVFGCVFYNGYVFENQTSTRMTYHFIGIFPCDLRVFTYDFAGCVPKSDVKIFFLDYYGLDNKTRSKQNSNR